MPHTFSWDIFGLTKPGTQTRTKNPKGLISAFCYHTNQEVTMMIMMITNHCAMRYVKHFICIIRSTLQIIQELSSVFFYMWYTTGRLSNIPSIIWPEGGGGGVTIRLVAEYMFSNQDVNSLSIVPVIVKGLDIFLVLLICSSWTTEKILNYTEINTHQLIHWFNLYLLDAYTRVSIEYI